MTERSTAAAITQAEVGELAATLRAAIGDLDAHVHRRAEAIAAPRIAEVERAAAARIADLAAEHDRERQWLEDLAGELTRQLVVLERDRLRLSYAARHLPAPVRRLLTGVWPHPGPLAELEAQAPGWCHRVDTAAARAATQPVR